jgi:hypothetical protein
MSPGWQAELLVDEFSGPVKDGVTDEQSSKSSNKTSGLAALKSVRVA